MERHQLDEDEGAKAVKCEICESEVFKPMTMEFTKNSKVVTWKICEVCALILTNYIKKMNTFLVIGDAIDDL